LDFAAQSGFWNPEVSGSSIQHFGITVQSKVDEIFFHPLCNRLQIWLFQTSVNELGGEAFNIRQAASDLNTSIFGFGE
jgi:hypothetical protein